MANPAALAFALTSLAERPAGWLSTNAVLDCGFAADEVEDFLAAFLRGMGGSSCAPSLTRQEAVNPHVSLALSLRTVPESFGSTELALEHVNYAGSAQSHHMSEADLRQSRNLAFAGLSAQLPIDFRDLSEACRAKWMAHAEQASAAINGDATVARGRAALDELAAFAFGTQAEALSVLDLFNRGCVVQLDEAQICGANCRALIRKLRRRTCEIRELRRATLGAARDRGRDPYRIFDPQAPHDVFAGEHGRGSAVAERAAV